MPKSKRQKLIHTSTTPKLPPRQRSATLFTAIRASLDQYTHVFLFSVDNMRNTYLKDVRQHFSDSRLYFGKTKVMAKALGLTPSEEYAPGLSELGGMLKGSVGILLSNRPVEEVLEWFSDFVELDFARAGAVANRTFTVPAGVVHSTGGQQAVEDDVPLPHSLEVTLRKWGMTNTRLDKGKVVLDADYTVCTEDEVLDSQQTAILKLFGVAMAEFRVRVVAHWSAATGEVTTVEEDAGVEAMEEA
ncbi:mRNA turnover and ribosome assembly protein [Oleoguttula sp. CCFEE 5521]